MATMQFEGLDLYISKLTRMQNATRDICGHIVYEGAKVVADAIKSGAQGLPVDEKYAPPGHMKAGITSAQKAGLIESLGIANMREENGAYNVKIGFDGYNSVRTKKYPGGQPNAMVARSVNTGTSFLKRTPFIDGACRSAKGAALSAMTQEADNQFKKYS